jgi:hypothetical protein
MQLESVTEVLNETVCTEHNTQEEVYADGRNNSNENEFRDARKANSTNSIFLTTTISKPSSGTIISTVATILHSQILEDIMSGL